MSYIALQLGFSLCKEYDYNKDFALAAFRKLMKSKFYYVDQLDLYLVSLTIEFVLLFQLDSFASHYL